MRACIAALLLVLVAVMALPPSIAPAEAQNRRGNRHGGDSRPPPPQEGSPTTEPAGKYGLSTTEVLEAIDRGEGRQRAFLYAGTPAVVTTLWKVDDRASYLLMRSFYEHLVAQGPAGALRTAQRALMVDFPHPFAWAAFGLTGAPR